MQSWNKFCFTQGRIEVATSLPGSNLISGLWPAAWIMGNLGSSLDLLLPQPFHFRPTSTHSDSIAGRAGYGASLEGLWPYSYESCDIGTLPNQTSPTGGPAFLTTQGLPQYNFDLSYLPGQRLSACTCPGEPHPGPVLSDGSFRGRSASEIDIFEATASPTLGGMISQSAQWGPMNPNYYFVNATTADVEYYTSPYDTIPNTYLGGAYQQVRALPIRRRRADLFQSTSALSSTNPATYDSKTNFAMYGLEYTPSHLAGAGKGNVSWLQEDESMWTLHEAAMAGNTDAMIGTRVITGEPMSIILNLGMSESFGNVSLNELVFPAVMRIDYVRVVRSLLLLDDLVADRIQYQPKGQTNVGCDPVDYVRIRSLPSLGRTADRSTTANIELYPRPPRSVLEPESHDLGAVRQLCVSQESSHLHLLKYYATLALEHRKERESVRLHSSRKLEEDPFHPVESTDGRICQSVERCGREVEVPDCASLAAVLHYDVLRRASVLIEEGKDKRWWCSCRSPRGAGHRSGSCWGSPSLPGTCRRAAWTQRRCSRCPKLSCHTLQGRQRRMYPRQRGSRRGSCRWTCAPGSSSARANLTQRCWPPSSLSKKE